MKIAVKLKQSLHVLFVTGIHVMIVVNFMAEYTKRLDIVKNADAIIIILIEDFVKVFTRVTLTVFYGKPIMF